MRLALANNTLRVEVTDTRAEKEPPPTPPTPDSASESGRGLLLIAALADGWGITPRTAAPGKTVWAELSHPPPAHPRNCATHPERRCLCNST